ncbi:NADH-quinone oxidoreductase subunit J [Thalassoglobus neptunius]|uniref:NADH-quinone oxidoreductase subunit J n=1 Tax=Thalassoglobus neptunius TaxID=1938619 RepID=A0A5C5X7W9_9PLAN|nr:NADH-quinone oxidoreductase subunit J [Thalassoglobus neptunius]TWT58779.1 NADH-quinone oxidoreductase subunit J [Thalassoglobus neptunius]
MSTVLFVIYALAASGGALAVVLSQNVVRMAFWLVISLSSVAGLFFLLGADFVGATQLLIYVGGTVVLLIFGVMLTSSGPYGTIKSQPAEVVQAGIIGMAFLALVASTVLSVNWEANEVRLAHANDHAEHGHVHEVSEPESEQGYNPEESGNTTRSLGTALLGVRFDKDLSLESEDGSNHGHTHGNHEVSAGYLLPFEIVSVHLLVVLVGAAYLARAKRRVDVENA